jgi:hypothetical protein
MGRGGSARCCGVRARGDAQAESDRGGAVFLRDMTDRGAENDRLADIGAVLPEADDEVVHAFPFAAPTSSSLRL